MPTLLLVSPHLTHDQLVARFRACKDSAEGLRWQAVKGRIGDLGVDPV